MSVKINWRTALACLCLDFLLISGSFGQDIRIETFRVGSETGDSTYRVVPKGTLVLDYRQTNISVSFIDSSNQEEARYAFQLEGLDRVWHEAGNNTSVFYGNLMGGEYTFQVKNLNFPQKTAAVHFHIEEAFWQRPWFIPMIVAYGLLILGIILYFFRIYRLRNEIRLQKLRNEIASDLHDDVGTTLSSISFLGEMARMRFRKKPEEVDVILDKIINESREMIQTMRGMVWTINPQNDSAADFFEKVKSFAEAILNAKQVRLQFSVQDLDKRELNLEVQRNLFLIFKEAIVNIAKHAEATEGGVVIKREHDHIWILIKDNGKGFDCTTGTEGNGLNNLRSRALQIGGELSVESEPGSGTRVKMVIPIT